MTAVVAAAMTKPTAMSKAAMPEPAAVATPPMRPTVDPDPK